MTSENRTSDMLDIAGKLTGLAFCVYLLGFVTSNAHLAKWGVYTFELLNVQYLAAGFVTAVAFAIFGFVVGRRLHHMNEDVMKLAELGKTYRWPRLWALFSVIFTFVELVFALVVAVIWTSMIFFRDTKPIGRLSTILSIVFLLDYLLMVSPGVYKRKPYIAMPLSFIVFIAALIAARPATGDERILVLLVLYLGAGIVLTFIFHILPVCSGTGAKAFLWFWTSIVVLSSASAFGSLTYGEVRRNLGGGEPSRVTLILVKDVPETSKAR